MDEKLKKTLCFFAPMALQSRFIDACRRGEIDVVKFVFENASLFKKLNLNKEYENGLRETIGLESFSQACINNRLNIIKFFYEHPQLSIFTHSNKNIVGNQPFTLAAMNNHIEALDLILTKPQNKEQLFKAAEKLIFEYEVDEDYRVILKKLLSSAGTKENSKFDNDFFQKVIVQQPNINLIISLIIDLDLTLTKNINAALSQSKNNYSQDLKKIFSDLELKKTLEKSISKQEIEIQTNKNKI